VPTAYRRNSASCFVELRVPRQCTARARLEPPYGARNTLIDSGIGPTAELGCASRLRNHIGETLQRVFTDLRRGFLTLCGGRHGSVYCGCLELRERGMMMDVLAEP